MLFPLLGFAQESTVSITRERITIREALEEIEKQTGLSFAYNQTQFDDTQEISLFINQTPLNKALDQILNTTNHTFRINRNHIILIPLNKKKGDEQEERKKPIGKTASATVKKVKTKGNPQRIPPFQVSKIKTKNGVVALPYKKEQALYPQLTRPSSATPLFRPFKPLFPEIAVKTNMLYNITATLNLGIEVRILEQFTIDLSVTYNPWTFSENKKFKHLLIQPELRYWLSEAFDKHFLGVHMGYARFNIGNIRFPLHVFRTKKENRYQGNAYGIGFSYGYQWSIAPRWSLETTLGVGYSYLEYKQYACQTCGKFIGKYSGNDFGLSRVGISLIYIIK
ncbi:DUF3575 domain-containing protein [Porphyromonadaceae bacterium OttesenSCG-928-L07]|nr:DUF3575 domain-containing protein [Porphyromonadaceae bacterium OttesenSCG-928-L07]MDL2251640.1 DUF3575 domain-containing protein [Odoribacter sp. OttesenSCG-928-J03]